MAAGGAFSTSSRAAAAWLLEAAAAWLLEVLFPPLAGLLQPGC
jgi:hypothetical protein